MNDRELPDFLDDLHARGRAHDDAEPDPARKRRNLDPETARLVSILVRSGGRRRLLEVGTSNGYSTTWLAWAARATGGRVTSIDRSAEKHAEADANLRRAGLRDLVDLLPGDATEVVASLPGPFDLVLFDADRTSAPAQLADLLPRLAPGALVLADNALSHPAEIAGYLAAISARPEFDHVVVPIGKGLSVAYLRAEGGSAISPRPPAS